MASLELEGFSYRMPDFMIGGAMKCATTTLHEILARHPRVFIPPGELKYFSIDDFLQQPEFFFPMPDGEWNSYDFHRDKQKLLRWYHEFYSEASEDSILGEDTPTYLASETSPQRIKAMCPNVKMIFSLREPVARTYSHYWHWVRSGRTPYGFVDALRQQAFPLMQRSFYLEQLRRFYEVFDESQIRVVLFEQFLADPVSVVDDLCDFIGVDSQNLNCETKSNPGSMPRFTRLKLLHNRINFPYIGYRHLKFLPGNRKLSPPKHIQLLNRIHRIVNPMKFCKPPPMDRNTKQFLTEYLAKRNCGLAELLGLPLAEYWGDAYAAR